MPDRVKYSAKTGVVAKNRGNAVFTYTIVVALTVDGFSPYGVTLKCFYRHLEVLKRIKKYEKG